MLPSGLALLVINTIDLQIMGQSQGSFSGQGGQKLVLSHHSWLVCIVAPREMAFPRLVALLQEHDGTVTLASYTTFCGYIRSLVTRRSS